MFRPPKKNHRRDYMVRYRRAKKGEDLLPPPDRRIRPLALCQKGECRWLEVQCLRPAGPCDLVAIPSLEGELGACCGTRYYNRQKEQYRPCGHLRTPCNRRLQNCPFGHRVWWMCENCGDNVPIGDIYFVQAGLKVTKHRYIARTQKDATAICGGCLEILRQHRKDDPLYWNRGIGALRSENLVKWCAS